MRYLTSLKSFIENKTYIRTYEGMVKEIKNGSYVIIKFFSQSSAFDIWADYINSSIGKVENYQGDECLIRFEVNDWIYDNFFNDKSIAEDELDNRKSNIKYRNNKKVVIVYADSGDILFYSNNRKDCEVFLAGRKYNI